MLKLYIADIATIPDPKEESEVMKSLSADRKIRISNMKSEKSRRQCLGAGLLLNKVLESYGKNYHDISFGEHGKPELDGFYFNLSHSEDMVICAVSDSPVGCDVEKLREAPKGIAERYFGKCEKQYLDACEAKDYDKAFFCLWTIRESYVKMTGEGLGIPRGSFEVVPGEEVRILRDGEVQNCHIYETTVNDYCISVCAGELGPVEIQIGKYKRTKLGFIYLQE